MSGQINEESGKSKLVKVCTRNIFEDFNEEYEEFVRFILKCENKIIQLQIWQTCGQEVYMPHSFIKNFCRNSSLAILLYAINDIDSFKHIENWIQDYRSQCGPDVKLFLVGNKIDIPETE